MERHRSELLLSLFAVRPVAVDLLISPRDGSVQFALRVLQLPQTPSNSQLSLHRAVFDDRTHILATLLANSPHANPNETDVHGNTPLHLACSLGRHRAVELLLRYGALPTMPNIEGWHPVAEALSYGNRAIIERVWFAHRRMLDVALRSRKSAILDELNKGSSDFYLEMKWSFSSWIPFTARFCPSDTLKIYKKGSRLRADFTLVGFDNLQWQRGDRSFILSVNPKTSQSTSYLLDHETGTAENLDDLLSDDFEKRRARLGRFRKLRQRMSRRHEEVPVHDASESDSDGEQTLSDWETVTLQNPMLHKMLSAEVDAMMCGPIADTSSPGQLTFKQATTGYFMFKKPLVETVNGHQGAVFDVGNANLSVKRRVEHLSDAEKAEHERMSSMFGLGSNKKASVEEIDYDDSRVATDDEEAEQQRMMAEFEAEQGQFEQSSSNLSRLARHKQSLPPPPSNSISFDNYLSTGVPLGRDREQSEVNKTFKARVWMCDSFPLHVNDLVRIVTVLAPHHKHLETLRSFIAERLPPGFPVRVQMPVFPTVKATIDFVNYEEAPQDESLFEVPVGYEPGQVNFM